MVNLSGKFLMGSNDQELIESDGEGFIREVEVDNFLIDKTSVTNLEFSKFVTETNYITDAERFGWSFVFNMFILFFNNFVVWILNDHWVFFLFGFT